MLSSLQKGLNESKLLRELNIPEIVNRYVPLKPRGKRFIGLCPFHSELRPSFTLYPDGSFICYGRSCGKKGSFIDFIRMIEDMTYDEAVSYLENECKIQGSALDLNEVVIDEHSI